MLFADFFEAEAEVRPRFALFFGTRPQVIKASILRDQLALVGTVAAVDTGQHYDYRLHQIHYQQLGVRPPDEFLAVGSGGHADQTASLMTASAGWLVRHRPDVAIVIGDTNTTLGCALAAAKLRVPVAHVEAGLHARDRLMAEEINRRAVDAISSWLFAPCERIATELRRSYPDASVEMVGDVARDVLRRALPAVPALTSVGGYQRAWGHDYIYATLHRAELVDAPDLLGGVIATLAASPLPVLFAAHPRTRALLERLASGATQSLQVIEPVGYLESISLIQNARAVVTDSGGLQREAYWLGVPCVTVREETEWLETVTAGANRLVSPSAVGDLADALGRIVDGAAVPSWDVGAYGDGHAASRVAATLGDGL